MFGAPPSVVVTWSVPIAPLSGSLWMPTTTAVSCAVECVDEHAASAASARTGL